LVIGDFEVPSFRGKSHDVMFAMHARTQVTSSIIRSIQNTFRGEPLKSGQIYS
jgi:hypothetical protein